MPDDAFSSHVGSWLSLSLACPLPSLRDGGPRSPAALPANCRRLPPMVDFFLNPDVGRWLEGEALLLIMHTPAKIGNFFLMHFVLFVTRAVSASWLVAWPVSHGVSYSSFCSSWHPISSLFPAPRSMDGAAAEFCNERMAVY